MPIHDQGYRRYTGGRDAKGQAWLVIARAGIRNMISKRLFLALLAVSWARFVYECIRVYLTTNFSQLSILATNAKTFRDFLEFQELWIFFVTIYVGAGLIAADRRANALQIYLSKPLTRLEYVAGKATVLAVFLLGITWLPAMLLLAVQVLFAGSFTFVRQNLFLLPAITVYAFLQVMLATFAMLALSSLSKSARFVGIMYAGVIFFTDAIFGMLKYVVRASGASLISPTQSLAQLGDVIFRVPPRHETPVIFSLGIIVLMIAVAMLILERRIRGVEVVA
jgi:ABC-2 type transport system permease protein